MVVFSSKTGKETENIGRRLAETLRGQESDFSRLLETILPPKRKGALVLALTGDLGSGKTTFVKGLAKGLGIREKITSPTYVFVRSYSFQPIIRQSFHKDTLYHLDLYRLDNQDKKTLQSFGFDEIIHDPKGIAVIEWANRYNINIYGHAINLDFGYSGEDRQIKAYCG